LKEKKCIKPNRKFILGININPLPFSVKTANVFRIYIYIVSYVLVYL
jgi:hypothetical protein